MLEEILLGLNGSIPEEHVAEREAIRIWFRNERRRVDEVHDGCCVGEVGDDPERGEDPRCSTHRHGVESVGDEFTNS